MKTITVKDSHEAYKQLINGSNNLNDYITIIKQVQDKNIEVNPDLATRISRILSVGALNLKPEFMIQVIKNANKEHEYYVFATAHYLYANDIPTEAIEEFLRLMPSPFNTLKYGTKAEDIQQLESNSKNFLKGALVERGYILK